jgi:hypothetical protein
VHLASFNDDTKPSCYFGTKLAFSGSQNFSSISAESFRTSVFFFSHINSASNQLKTSQKTIKEKKVQK